MNYYISQFNQQNLLLICANIKNGLIEFFLSFNNLKKLNICNLGI